MSRPNAAFLSDMADFALAAYSSDASAIKNIVGGSWTILPVYTNLQAAAIAGDDGHGTLTIAFRGADDPLDLPGDLNDLASYYQLFSGFFSQISTYLADHPEITKVNVTGHSLGGTVAELFMHNSTLGSAVQAATFASPGTPFADSDSRIVNVAHTDDWVTTVPFLEPTGTQKLNIDLPLLDGSFPSISEHRMAEYRHSIYQLVYSPLYKFFDLSMHLMIGDAGGEIGANDEIGGTSQADFIVGASGDDVLSGGGNNDFVDGGSGNDSIAGSTGNDRLWGGAGDDNLAGGIGDDTLTGGDGSDTIRGGADADTLSGGNGIDTLSYGDAIAAVNISLATNTAARGIAAGDAICGFENVTGGAGDDALTGDGAANRLSGGGGNDRLAGGQGHDTLTGGVGADTFIFRLLNHSTVGATHDLITDFSRAQGDHIDLSVIDAKTGPGSDAFDFIGGAAFSSAAGELRYFASGGNTIVQGDVDGNGVADFEIGLGTLVTLVGADFIL